MTNKSIQSIDLNLFKILIALHEEKNVTKAGQAVFLSQPAVSHALNRLRYIFNDELFVRTNKGMQPTTKCLTLISPVADALEGLQSVLYLNNEFEPKYATGEFKFGMNDLYSSILSLDLIKDISAQAPDLQVNIVHTKGIDDPTSTTDAHADLDAGVIDLAILQDYETPPRFERESLGYFDHVCIASKNHPQIKDTLTLDIYQGLEHVLVTGTNLKKTTLGHALLNMGIKRKCKFKVPHFMTAMSMVENSNYICTMPRFISSFAQKKYDLQVLELPFDSPKKELFQVWHKTTTSDPLNKWIRQSIRHNFAKGHMLSQINHK